VRTHEEVVAPPEHLLDERIPRSTAKESDGNRNLLHTPGDAIEPLLAMGNELLFEALGDEVPNTVRHGRQHVHNLHARSTARRERDRVIERWVFPDDDIDVNENTGERCHSLPATREGFDGILLDPAWDG
jgi:hypothetical protein